MIHPDVDAAIQIPTRPPGQKVTSSASQTVVWLSGEQDASTADELSVALAIEGEALATVSPGSRLIVDVSEVTFLDAAILGALLSAHARRPLEVRGSPRCVRRLFEICEIGDRFTGDRAT